MSNCRLGEYTGRMACESRTIYTYARHGAVLIELWIRSVFDIKLQIG